MLFIEPTCGKKKGVHMPCYTTTRYAQLLIQLIQVFLFSAMCRATTTHRTKQQHDTGGGGVTVE